MMRGIKQALVVFMGAALLVGCGVKNTNKLPPVGGGSVPPDKELYQRALADIQHKKYDTARLELNALINTYPETEYLAKAKLAIADSFFKEGGTGNLAQAALQYKDFITFFSTLPEAAYAQMQVAMIHYRQLTKPDRDRTEAELCEQEFQAFLTTYPDSELAPVAAQHLREVQEVLAEGDFRIARYYEMKGPLTYKAAAGRLQDIADRYPLFSKSDQVLWMLANISEKAPSGNLQGELKQAFFAQRTKAAAHYYSQLVQNYPLSDLVPRAKERLVSLGAPVPQPDPAALARMQKEQEFARKHPGPLSHVSGVIHSGPDVSTAARVGTPNMNPPDDNGGGGETLNAALTNMNISASGASGGSSLGGRNEGTGAIQPGGGSSGTPIVGSSSGNAAPSTNPGTTPGTTPPAGTGTPSASGATPTPPASPAPTTNSAGTSKQDPQAKPCPTDSEQGDASNGNSKGGKSNGKSKGKTPDCNQDNGKESSSKKKSGIHRIIPW